MSEHVSHDPGGTTEQEWRDQLEKEGFTEIQMCPFNTPDIEFPEHTHDEHTVHVILRGIFIVTDETGTTALKEGDRADFPAGTIHSAKCGPHGCTFLAAVKKHESGSRITVVEQSSLRDTF